VGRKLEELEDGVPAHGGRSSAPVLYVGESLSISQGTALTGRGLVQSSLSPDSKSFAEMPYQEGPLPKSTRVDQRAAKSETATLENEPVVQTKRVATKEEERLYSPFKGFVPPWRRWGPYLSARSWGTVREDYSPNGDAWNYLNHDKARSKAYRWGEDAIAGICDRYQILCFGLALWNGRDPILKERLFGLTSQEGNRGEDVKEYYFYLDNTPSHSYMKMLYKYPQAEFPYSELVEENRLRGGSGPEYELIDTGVFDADRYFDVFVEFAKVDAEDICIKIEAFNRGPDEAELHLIPTLWFRNTWGWTDPPGREPTILRGIEDECSVLWADDTGGDRLHFRVFGWQSLSLRTEGRTTPLH